MVPSWPAHSGTFPLGPYLPHAPLRHVPFPPTPIPSDSALLLWMPWSWTWHHLTCPSPWISTCQVWHAGFGRRPSPPVSSSCWPGCLNSKKTSTLGALRRSMQVSDTWVWDAEHPIKKSYFPLLDPSVPLWQSSVCTGGSDLASWSITNHHRPMGEVYDILMALPTPTPGLLFRLKIVGLPLHAFLRNLSVLTCLVVFDALSGILGWLLPSVHQQIFTESTICGLDTELGPEDTAWVRQMGLWTQEAHGLVEEA